jgi:hypothetical protein
MALPTATQAALRSVVSEFWSNDALAPTEAMRRLGQIAAAPTK